MVLKKRKDPIKLIYLLLGSLVANTGTSFIWPLTTIYVNKYLHESLTVAGMVLFLNLAFAFVGNSVGGWLFDKWHPYQTIAIGVLITAISSGCLIFWHGWPSYAIFLITLGLGNGIVVTSLNSAATMIRSKNPSYVFNLLYFTQNLGLVFGSLIVGFILPLGITLLFILALIMFTIFEILVLTQYRGLNAAVREVRHKTIAHHERIRLSKSNRWQIITLLSTVLCIWIAYQQWASNISTYMLGLHLSVQSYSILWTLNAIIIVIFQPLLTYFDDFLTEHLHTRLYVGFSLFILSFVILLFARQWLGFASSMTVLTLGEILSLPAVSTFVNDRAPESEKGRYQGLVQAVVSAGRALGPLVGALIIDNSSYFFLFIVCGIIITLPAISFAVANMYSSHKA